MTSSDKQESYLSQVAPQLAAKTLEHLHNPARLQALHRLKLLDSPPEAAFDRLTSLLSRILKVPVSLVSLVDSDRQYFKSQVGLPEPWATQRETGLSHSFCQYVVSSGLPLVVSDARQDPTLKDNLAINDLQVIAYAGMPLNTSDGQTLGSFCAINPEPHEWTDEEITIIRDLAQAVITEIELRHYTLDLEAANRELDAYAHTVAHDLKNPLNTIIGYTAILREDEKDMDGHQQEALLGVADAADDMQHLIDELLTLAETRQSDVELVAADANTVLKQVLRRFATQREQIQIVDSLPPAMANERWLAEVFANLISNALKYMGADNPAPLVRVEGKQEDDVVRYQVCDNGVGIHPDEQERLFELFARSPDTKGQVEGSGLGLTLVKQMVEKMGGRIGVQSKFGEGSTFWFELAAPDTDAAIN